MSIRRLFPAFGVVALALLMRGVVTAAAAPMSSQSLNCVTIAGHPLAMTPEQQLELAAGWRQTPEEAGSRPPPCAVTLLLTNSINKQRPHVGEIVTWTVSVANQGRATAPHVVVDDRLPWGERTWSVGDLAPGQSLSLAFHAVVTRGGSQSSCALAFSLVPALPSPESAYGALQIGMSGTLELGRTTRVCATSAASSGAAPNLGPSSVPGAAPTSPSSPGSSPTPTPAPSPTASATPVSSPSPRPNPSPSSIPSPGPTAAGAPAAPVASPPSGPRPASLSKWKPAPVHSSPTPVPAYVAPARADGAGATTLPSEIVAGLPDTGWPVWSGLTGLVLIAVGTLIAWAHLRRVVWPALVFYGEGLMHWIDRLMDLR